VSIYAKLQYLICLHDYLYVSTTLFCLALQTIVTIKNTGISKLCLIFYIDICVILYSIIKLGKTSGD